MSYSKRCNAVPVATYRLQFNAAFTYAEAIGIVPYLQQLGISHIYASPLLRARAGSAHGYDIVDHNAFNSEIGDAEAFRAFSEVLQRHDMGMILDTVPNHMDVGGNDNEWWRDVLEHGEASEFATFFDIDWHPVKAGLQHKVLLPVLGEHYGRILDGDQLQLNFDRNDGSFRIEYFEHHYPIDPRSYPQLIRFRLPELIEQAGAGDPAVQALSELSDAFLALPGRTPDSIAIRRDQAEVCKRRLASLCNREGAVADFLETNVRHLNDRSMVPEWTELLHQLLEAQAYRLAYWRVAAHEINYRRFFDINELAAIRMENPAVFDITHQLIRQLVGSGAVNGLRIDHADGLSDPGGYCQRLQDLLGEGGNGDETRPLSYLLVEKILAPYETLPGDWPVCGTTGYEVASLLNGLFVNPASERAMTRLYQRFVGYQRGFDEILYDRKKLVIFNVLPSELTVLANLLDEIAQSDRHTRDFTYHGLREALAEIVACFPVYRTYVAAAGPGKDDRHFVHWAITLAKHRSLAADTLILDFIEQILLLQIAPSMPSGSSARVQRFVARFQQYTAPVMAKGMEDTALYVYNRLVSLNDVGSSPAVYGIAPAAFHHAIGQRRADWPDAMVATSTHDNKRSEDVRVRIDVLSELEQDWRRHLGRWSHVNRNRKRLVGKQAAPSRNDEYLLYQTMLGIWPLQNGSLDELGERLKDYLLKAVREAKTHTSWVNPDPEYEQVIGGFIEALLRRPGRNAFLADFLPFQQRVAHYGLLNGLSQTLLKLTLPGVPDIYQGNEVWRFDLVDPDNRRPVDYRARQALLDELIGRSRSPAALPLLLHELLDNIADGRAKLYLSWRSLQLRRNLRQLFSDADYRALSSEGRRSDHIVGFARCHAGRCVISVAARWYVGLIDSAAEHPCGEAVWTDTLVRITDDDKLRRFHDVLSGQTLETRWQDGHQVLRAAELFTHWPVALLVDEPG